MKHVFYILTLFLFVIACNQSKTETPQGTYYGTLPCADCPGINYMITFENDSTYSEIQFYQERSVDALKHTGNFNTSEDGTITLTDKEDSKGMKQFKLENDTLQLLDVSGKPITGNLSDRYLLTNNKPENFSMEAKKENKAIGFKATGNEPFWNLEIDFANKTMKFKTLEGDSIVTPLPKLVKPQDIDAVSYRAQTESGALHVMIIRDECTDSMSGKKSGYKVRASVQLGDADMKDYNGCGEYKGDYRLHDLWVLESLNGEQMDSKTKAPNLEFNLVENKLYGFGGCNRINSDIKTTNNSIKIGSVIATKMACPNLSTEKRFLDAISEKELNFSFSEGKLTLKNSDNTLVFKKVD
ncbi:copper resistance protein NlpE N-terminal domain-containing protein [Marixanthomonas ophiurae]|uniref:META domain-containing protein n=1 Tax=Marixanthomonas ophiurae TaxID=387659 RepID=A0A3E1Q6J2_9FLAO|nr:copper resistance protein NlpE N-terminal domain-containing protein [Marixanthomonas ophiurae]RFN57744.1 META domain-containing protein [Marixanthomonas ophiurae]